MPSRLPIVRFRHSGTSRHHLLRRQVPALTGLALVGIMAFGSSQAGLIPHSARAATAPASHAEVIAQAVVDLADGPLAWSVSTIEAGERATALASDGAPGFVLGIENAVLVRGRDGIRSRLAGGEAVALRPADALTVQASGAGSASVSLLTLDRAASGSSERGPAGEAFASPGGSRDVELLRDVLAEGEATQLDGGNAPVFVLATSGTVAIEPKKGERQTLKAGETALVTGDFAVTGAAADPSSFVAAVIGPDVDESAATAAATPGQSRPQPTAPTQPTDPSATPTTVPPTPTPSGNGPDDDPDEDDLTNKDEATYGTDPLKPDTDGDLIYDGYEVHQYATSPTALDFDQDGLYDGDEVIRVESNPAVYDTDGDQISDGDEANVYFTSPLKPDTDDDGYNDYLELLRGTNPTVVDTDQDGLTDGQEVNTYHTDPLNYDSDGDGAPDGDEVNRTGTDPNNPDSDGDGLKDTEEAFLGTDPWDPDTDGDTIYDGSEFFTYHTDPLDSDSHP